MVIPINSLKLPHFLVKAKIATYASGSDDLAVKPAFENAYQLEYTENKFLYRDIYFGGSYFIGMKIVFWNEQPIWGMSYYGGVLPGISDQQSVEMPSVLKAALREVPLDAPFRGPVSFQDGDYLYKNEIHGDISIFHGTENIRVQEQPIYRLFYHGGLVE